MSAAEVLPLNRLLNLAPLVRLREVAFAAASRLHLVRLDRLRPDRAQLRALLGLVHRARATLFGREHDFSRIRSPEDFRRLVPLRTPAELAREYPGPGQTWPGGPGPIVLPRPLPREGSQAFPLSPGLLASHRQALRTALALILNARPRTSLFGGRLLWLGDDSLVSPGDPVQLAGRRFPLLARPGLCALPGRNGHADEDLAEHAVRLGSEPITCLAGPAERIARFLLAAQAVRGGGDPCPGLVAALYTRREPGFSADTLRRLVGPRVLLVEMLARPEGAVAVEDPRHRGLRLLADHGVYFEFVPVDEVDRRQPRRLGLDEVRTGVPYEVALTSPAGWWACRSGLVVAFDRLAPPLVRVLTPAVPEPAPVTLRPSHRQSAGSPAGLREMPAHSPWSVPVDRG